ncbi:NADPH-dependent FMN reductase [Xinfangfangia sp. CPCC 101601]|uniref:NADPH-dependent FMN reductase n=1 Tax=Pseudogemmobacter lacusdianii TaxID=3069608 RepID=A0ABU0VZY2_9RHOB|nr:NADPH-dependent FMN reductase [Xinfangfangia sp. CPCC 101601]MDQ2066450.1 NADPH-dependent FMN reductase [Xinfangfangia sp. CPCC 101601]
MVTLLGIPGALRAGSTNRLLLAQARLSFGEATHTEADLRLPLYDGDLEAESGIPEGVQRLADQIEKADAVVIACPEYNKAPPGVVKNALDWVSRLKGNPWKNKPLALIAAAGGRGGGDRSQFALRLMVTPFQPHLLTGPEVLVADSGNAFDETGRLKDARYQKALDDLMGQLRRAAEA